MRASVIIPAHNAAATLPRTLAAVGAQDISEDFEIVVADDASTDDTAAIAEEAGATVVRHERPLGPGPARNAAVAAARGEVLAFTDADCFPRPDWLRRGLEAAGGLDLVQGAVRAEAGVPAMPFDRTVWVVAEVGLYETANLFVRRDWFERVGGFEDWLGARIGKPLAEDVWLGWRLRRAGARHGFCPEAVVEHAVFRRGPREYVSERLRATYFPDIVEKVPELRREFLFARTFLSRRTAAFDMALAGIAAGAVAASPIPLLAAFPYAWMAGRSAARWRFRSPLVAVTEVVADAVTFATLVAGSARRRTPVL